jgi:hypothetical protein
MWNYMLSIQAMFLQPSLTHFKASIQSSRVLVPAGTSKSTLRRHGIQAYVADAVTL